METRRRSPLRFIAPLALLAAAVALMLVIASGSSGGGPSASQSQRAAEKQRDLGASKAKARQKKSSAKKDKLPQKVYVVKSGDTLGGIASKTGVPVERLQELNPGLDQFQLVAGDEIKLR
jgi:LysM repeat protein